VGAAARPPRRDGGVAQIFNLLYRRFAIGKALKSEAFRQASGSQNEILRYGRLKICATASSAA